MVYEGVGILRIELSDNELKALIVALTGVVDRGKKTIDKTGKAPTFPDWKSLNEAYEKVLKAGDKQ